MGAVLVFIMIGVFLRRRRTHSRPLESVRLTRDSEQAGHGKAGSDLGSDGDDIDKDKLGYYESGEESVPTIRVGTTPSTLTVIH